MTTYLPPPNTPSAARAILTAGPLKFGDHDQIAAVRLLELVDEARELALRLAHQGWVPGDEKPKLWIDCYDCDHGVCRDCEHAHECQTCRGSGSVNIAKLSDDVLLNWLHHLRQAAARLAQTDTPATGH